MSLSIVTPVKNAARYLGACLESVGGLIDAGVVAEHVIVDGGSSDETVWMLERAAAARPGVTFWVEPGESAADSYMRAIGMAKGAYILSVMGDDVASPNLALVLRDAAFWSDSPPDLILAGVAHVDQDLEPLAADYAERGRLPQGHPPRRNWAVFNLHPGLNGAIFRREMVAGLAIPPSLRLTNDRFLMFHLLAQARRAVCTREIVQMMRHHVGSASNNRTRDIFHIKTELMAFGTLMLARQVPGPARRACAAYLMKTRLSLALEGMLRGGKDPAEVSPFAGLAHFRGPLFWLEAVSGTLDFVRGRDRFAGPVDGPLDDDVPLWRNRIIIR